VAKVERACVPLSCLDCGSRRLSSRGDFHGAHPWLWPIRRPYGEWLRNQRIEPKDLDTSSESHGFCPDTLLARMQAFGYTGETMQFMLLPLVYEKRDPIGSMGNDSPLAVLSERYRPLSHFFRQNEREKKTGKLNKAHGDIEAAKRGGRHEICRQGHGDECEASVHNRRDRVRSRRRQAQIPRLPGARAGSE